MFSSHAWFWYALLSAVFAALTAIFAKIGVDKLDSDYAMLIRLLIVLCIAIALVVARGRWVNPAMIASRTWIALALSGIATGLSWMFYFRAIQAGPVSVVAPIDKLSIALVAIFAVVFLGEHLRLGQWMGLALILIGSGLIAYFQE